VALVPLASLAELELRLGMDLPVRALALLHDASAKFRLEAGGQEITLSETTVRINAAAGTCRLPQVPVVAIESVKDLDGNDVAYVWDGLETLDFSTGVALLSDFAFEPIRSRTFAVDVTYTHGYDPVPDDVVAAVCQIAGRAYGNPSTEAGITQETTGSYSYSRGSAAGSGPLGMLEDERAVAHRYRRVGATAWLR
jgi:hypothetical protein